VPSSTTRPASIERHENELGLSGLMLGLLDGYNSARWGELAGQTPAEYEALRQAIAVFEPLEEVDGRLLKSGADVTDRVAPSFHPGARRPRRIMRNARTNSRPVSVGFNFHPLSR
jgi:hypothetical protein